YPELFENDGFVELLNAAKWRVWLACLSDLGAFSGGLLARRGMPEERVGMLMRRLVDQALAKTGIPAEADEGFAEHAQQVRARVARTVMAPDAGGVRGSVRFRWQGGRPGPGGLRAAQAGDAAFEP